MTAADPDEARGQDAGNRKITHKPEARPTRRESGGYLQVGGEGLPGGGGKASWGPSGWLLSRTATAEAVVATSTQVPPLLPL
jgi:hypothetical protein